MPHPPLVITLKMYSFELHNEKRNISVTVAKYQNRKRETRNQGEGRKG